eukprot:TRINITY_DN20072_c0_g1_i2.p2 TRINITY_DN20072_c0_g1~~TRINITY_DN20072_c0_g1_i2.p2  ORF type:complete len:126 (+),score=21.90 TRINITY_DN20072_c0_g1_i2:66-443(+)
MCIRDRYMGLKYLTATDIKIKLSEGWGINANEVSGNLIGRILNEYSFVKKTINGVRRYAVMEKTDTEIKGEQEYIFDEKKQDLVDQFLEKKIQGADRKRKKDFFYRTKIQEIYFSIKKFAYNSLN